MKKLRKFTFDEMRQNMVCIEEDAQREYVGGKYYYKSDGTFLYSDGSGNEVMIKDVVGSGGSTPSGSSNDCDTLCSYQKLSQASDATKGAIFNTMAKSVGVSSVQVRDLNDKGLGGACNRQGVITINTNSYLLEKGDFNNIMCTIIHEKHHSDTLQDHGTDKDELEALEAEKACSYWSGTTSIHKNTVESQISELKEKLGIK